MKKQGSVFKDTSFTTKPIDMDKFTEILMCVPEDTTAMQGFDELKEVFEVVKAANYIARHYYHDDWSMFVEVELIRCNECGGSGKVYGTVKWCGSCVGYGMVDGEVGISAMFEQHVETVSNYTGTDLRQMLIEWAETDSKLPIQSILNAVSDKAYPTFAKHIMNYNLKHFDL